ncbi:MAG: Zn-dependent exopeptidase M28 [archaeon]|nr:Zn-dependent exopeptidase M28 [archaeon]
MTELKIKSTNVQDAMTFTDDIVKSCHPRYTTFEGCNKAAENIMDEMNKYCDEGSVKIEDFELHPRAFVKFIRPAVGLVLIGAFLLFINQPIFALLACLSGAALFISQFVFYWGFFDFLFPKGIGHNVYGSIEPKGEVKQQIIVSGHHDAQFVFHLMDRVPKLYPITIIAGIFLLLITIILSITSIIASIAGLDIIGFTQNFVIIMILVGSPFIIGLWFMTTEEIVPGAGDNIIAVAMAIEIAKLFGNAKKNGNNLLEHTRIIAASFDSEEVGLRGARAYCKKHKQELLDTKTYVFNIDGIYKLKHLTFLESDLNTFVKLSVEMAQECAQIAKDLGYDHIGSRKFLFGGGATDSAEFGKIGVETTNLLGIISDFSQLNKSLVYHTSRDTIEHIEPEAVEAGLKIALKYIQKKDSEI